MKLLSIVRAAAIGFRDGWRQPRDLSTSMNIEHLPGYDEYDLQEWQDWGINWGQALRSPLHHQNDGFSYSPPCGKK